jgi:choice-of-anchor C domain-containing protein
MGNLAVHAQTLNNGSFESGTNAGVSVLLSAPDSSAITGWSILNGTVDYIGTRWTAGEGARCLDLNGTSPATIAQDIIGLVPGISYELSFLMAGNPEGPPATKSLEVSVGSLSQMYSFSGVGSPANLGWSQQTMNFTATAATMPLSFSSLTAGIYGPALDNVRIVPVPEPTPTALGFLALVSVMIIRARTRLLKTRC